MRRLFLALAGIVFALPAFAQQAVLNMYQSGADGSVAIPVSPTNPLPVTNSGASVAQGSTTSGQTGGLAQGAVTTSAPTYTTGQTSPLSLTTGGAVRFNPSGTDGTTCTAALNTGVKNCVLQIGGEYLAAPTALTNAATNMLMLTSMGSLRTAAGGNSSSLNITAAANVKASTGRVYRVVLNTIGSTATTIIDSTGTTVTAANTILAIPATATAGTVFVLDWPCATGISVVPGTGAVLSISYE